MMIHVSQTHSIRKTVLLIPGSVYLDLMENLRSLEGVHLQGHQMPGKEEILLYRESDEAAIFH